MIFLHGMYAAFTDVLLPHASDLGRKMVPAASKLAENVLIAALVIAESVCVGRVADNERTKK